jgi:hypothetical protein
METLNWSFEKGVSPYDYKTFGKSIYLFEEPVYEILYEDSFLFDYNFNKTYGEAIQKISMNHSIYNFHLLEKVEQSKLIFEYGVENPKLNIGDDINNQNLFDDSKPIITFITYPVQYLIETKIFPLKSNNYNAGFPLGYYSWQISKIYAEIFKNHWLEAGVWGHGLEDLYLESIELYKNNIVQISIGS